ncbi:MAG: hypothetical protein K2G24_05285 [Muribaculaceae bacterium]|nr:hypothetical protein [Muribaculaceae bacterium]
MKHICSKHIWPAVVAAVLAPALQSCETDEPYYNSGSWFAGRSFSAYARPGSYNDIWVADFFYDGHFQISPCDINGFVIPGMEIYEGNYTVNYDLGRVYLSYYNYSMNSMWTFNWWDEYDNQTGTYPYMEIFTAPGSGPLDNLTFYPY